MNMETLPIWIVGEIAEAWLEYVDQRRKDKKAMTPRSMLQRIKRLQELKDAGYDPLECLDQSINCHYLDFYPPKDKSITKINGKPDRAWADDLERARVASQTPEAKAAAAKVRQLVRRA